MSDIHWPAGPGTYRWPATSSDIADREAECNALFDWWDRSQDKIEAFDKIFGKGAAESKLSETLASWLDTADIDDISKTIEGVMYVR